MRCHSAVSSGRELIFGTNVFTDDSVDSFGPDTNFPFPSPTGPPPGPSLLDENDSRYLDNFFQGVDSNDINFDLFTNADDVFHGTEWQELPPTFMGTSSSFGQQPAQPQPPPQVASSSHDIGYKAQDMNFKAQDMAFSDMNGSMRMHDDLPSTTSPDVMAAAQTLLSNGLNNRSHSMGTGAIFGASRNNSMVPTNGHGVHQPMFPSRSRPTPDVRPSHQATYPPEAYFRDILYGGEVNQEAIAAAHDVLQPEKSRKIEIRWGSDAGFGTEQGFVPPPEQETAEEVEIEHIRRMKDFAHELSVTPAAESQSSSPQPQKSAARVKVEDEDTRARKRRKSKYLEDGEEPSAPSRQSGSSKKRKSIAKLPEKSPSSPATETSSKRKKSSGASSAVRPARENLTEDQKRENHIKSEQKRRTLIREGFDDLGELVPGLRGGGFSKSAVLVMAADWLEDLLKGNQVLKERIKDLERGGG